MSARTAVRKRGTLSRSGRSADEMCAMRGGPNEPQGPLYGQQNLPHTNHLDRDDMCLCSYLWPVVFPLDRPSALERARDTPM